MEQALWETDLKGLAAPYRGKVRDIYDLGESLLIVACDRVSAYDYVLKPGIPGKGKILNQLTNFWFEETAELVPNHLLAVEAADFPAVLEPHRDLLAGRSVVVKKASVVPFECVARGYLAGSAYREYARSGRACGLRLERGLERASQLAQAIFTPATKATDGHDENVDFATLVAGVGEELAEELRTLTLKLYRHGSEVAHRAGLILADTKFEFGRTEEGLLLIDEVLTPDSSRYWEGSAWRPGEEPASFDKQYVRNWLDSAGWDHNSPPPELPPEIVEGTRNRYREAFRRIVGREPEL